MSTSAVDSTVATLWRVESPRLIARIGRLVSDLDTAEELAQDTFTAALEKWRADGIPDNPAAWLSTTSRYLAIDRIRRRDTGRDKVRTLAATTPETSEIDLDTVVDGDLADDLLGLVFMACHPLLAPDARSALVLKLVCGLTTKEVANSFLVSESTVAQRIVRAKRTLSAANVRFELPSPQERPARLDAVREVIYLLFNEGYAVSSGAAWTRADLCQEAVRLGRMLAELTPRDPETLGLLALMELQLSRLAARVGPRGQPVLLLDQDRTRWDRTLIRRGLALIDRIDELRGTAGPYALQAALAACHARAARPEDTDWERIAALYDGLVQVMPSPVVELNRAVAVGRAFGPEAGLEIIEPLRSVAALSTYHLLPAVAGDLECAAGDHEAARADFLRAAALAGSDADRMTMQQRALDCICHGQEGAGEPPAVGSSTP